MFEPDDNLAWSGEEGKVKAYNICCMLKIEAYNTWGTPSRRGLRVVSFCHDLSKNEWTPPYVDDERLEIVGFRNAWHGADLCVPSGHGTRLAQARGIRFEFHKGATDHTFMRMDAEPWKQQLPEKDDTVAVVISRFGQVNMLATGTYPFKSVTDSLTPHEGVCDIMIVSRGFLHLASSKQLVVVVLVAELGPEFVLGFAPVESTLSQLDLLSAPLGLHLVSPLVHVESVVVHL
ncbi:diacylglycerol kinase 5-like protein, partial [Tanacetum coccineum]